MIRFLATIVLAALVAASAVAAPEAAKGSDLSECQSLLNVATEVAERPNEAVEAARRYREAFARCPDPRGLDLETGAKLSALRGEYLYRYERDYQSAASVYQETLAWVTDRGGIDHPLRIELLEGLAAVEARKAIRDQGSAQTLRVEELYREALRVREAVYGSSSVEASKGLLLLAAFHLDAHPSLAEDHAREALRISIAKSGLVARSTADALTMLVESLERQGKTSDAAEVEAQLEEVLATLPAT